jgi:replicative DNA helicase
MGYTDQGGFFKGAVHAIIAPSGKGKSTFAKCLVNHWADTGYKVLFVNFEEAVTHWERVLMTQIIGKNVYAEARTWTEEQKEKNLKVFKDRLSEWGDRFMVRHDPDTPYFEDLERWLRDIMGHADSIPDVVVIDTIQSMFTRGAGKGKPRWGEFEEMMVRLEKLARDMNCVLIITAQENANRMKERREVVQQSDTGGSLAIQQKCAVTIFITEKKLISGDDSEDETIMQLQIPKNRITGSTFVYDSPLVRYVDEKKTYEEYEPITNDSYTSVEGQSYIDEIAESMSII